VLVVGVDQGAVDVEDDPAFADAFVQALSQLAAEVRTVLFSDD
jgi:hypothetical protein